MACNEENSLQNYVDFAIQQFDECEKRLSQIEENFQIRMNGKTIGGLIRALFGTICWFLIFCIFFWSIREYINSNINLVGFSLSTLLVVFMFSDEVVSLLYYRKIITYKKNIVQLRNRINVGRSSIKSNQDMLLKSKLNNWNYSISVSPSIPEEASSIESKINDIASLKGGFINGIKNFLFFTFTIAVVVVGSWTLFETAEIMTGIVGEPISNGTMLAICIIGEVIAVIIEIILAKIVWGKTDCSVTNTTLFISVVGPIMFLALAVTILLLVLLGMWAIRMVVIIAIIAIIVAIFWGAISGR